VEYFTSRNLVILSLAQFGVIVAAILGASAAHKWYTIFRAPEPLVCQVLMSYGWLALALPVIWLWLTVGVFGDQRFSDEARLGMLLAGFALLALFCIIAWCGAAYPLLRLMGW
jgi:hypothetical protein